MTMDTNIIALNFTEKGLDSEIRKNTPPFTLKDIGGANSYTGLTIQVTEKSKSYILNKKINGKTYRRKVGDYSDISHAIARKRARDLVVKLQEGIDPNKTRKHELAKEDVLKFTIQNAIDEFIDDSPALAASTIEGYNAAIKLTFGTVNNKSLFSVTPELISKLHLIRSKKTKAKADHDMRVFRLLWNWAVNKYKKDCPEIATLPNPVSDALNAGHRAGVKGWNKVPRKQSIIPRKKLPEWFAALYKLRIKPTRSTTRETAVYLTEFLILTGLRFNEATTLTWNNIDLNKDIFIIEDTTGKNRQELIKPITNRIKEIINIQKDKHDIYVFPGLDGHLKDTRDFRAKLIEDSGIEFTNHDLRRVYLSAGSRAEVSSDILKRLVNHLPKTQDVTAGYIIQSLDELQDYAQRIEDQILTDAGLKDKSIDNTLMSLLSGMSEHEKRKMIFQLSSDLVSGGEKNG
jgi:integrase